MAVKSVLGPFRPGSGGMPPHLAGRESEQSFFRDLLTDLSNGVSPPSEVILYGPRGNGKTVLLRWLEQEAESRPGIEAVRLTPSEISSRTRLAEELLPELWWSRYAPSEVALAGIVWRPGKDRPPSPRTVLAARAGKAPLVLLLDEAHMLDPEVGRELLNASQEVGRDLPFLLVLAGTPNLQSHLGQMGASFWNRAEQVRVGRLSGRAAAEALRLPFEQEGIAFGRDALAAMVAESQHYPYFVQLLGRAVWGRVAELPAAPREVTPDALASARPEFERRREAYYRHRHEELGRRRLLGVGRAVAAAFLDRPVLSEPELERAIRHGLREAADPERTDRAREALCDLGYIWGRETRPEWEPGIPSLMDYIREHAPPC